MSDTARRILLMLLLAVAVTLGWQRPPALACAMDDPGCGDHCAVVAASCATACHARLAPVPVVCPAPGVAARSIAFSFEQPIAEGIVVTPDTAPPRAAA